MFKLTLVTPEKKIIMGEQVQEVTVPAFKGELNILGGHAPLMTTLDAGILSVKLGNGSKTSYAISWGYCQVSAEGVNVLAEFAMAKDEVDAEASKNAVAELEAKLAEEMLDDEAFEKIFAERAKSQAAYELSQLKD
jgi:F-type H+-transporting ATPase subunit epsilon